MPTLSVGGEFISERMLVMLCEGPLEIVDDWCRGVCLSSSMVTTWEPLLETDLLVWLIFNIKYRC